MNEKYPYLKNFFRESMFENLIIILVLDLSKPGQITTEFIEWISYINDHVMTYIMELDQKVRDKMNYNFNMFFQKN